MVKNREINGTEEIVLVTPTPVIRKTIHTVTSSWFTLSSVKPQQTTTSVFNTLTLYVLNF